MNNKELLEQFGKVVEAKLEAAREHTQKLIHEEVAAAAEKRLTQKIEASMEEIIDVLSEIIHKWFNIHEERINAIEEQLDIPHKN